MEIIEVLENLGLREGEIKVFLDLLKYGNSPVSKIKERTQLHRTTIYDFLESLINKGIVSYIKISGVKFYSAKEPEILFNLIEEKSNMLKSVFDELKNIKNNNEESFSVEVFKGKEGFKYWLNDMVKEQKDVYGFGIDEKIFSSKFKYEVAQYFQKRKNLEYKERLLTKENPDFLYKDMNTTYRYLPEKYFNPTPTVVYSNKVVIIIWEPMHLIIIKNSNLADSYKKNFEMLWTIAGK